MYFLAPKTSHELNLAEKTGNLLFCVPLIFGNLMTNSKHRPLAGLTLVIARSMGPRESTVDSRGLT